MSGVVLIELGLRVLPHPDVGDLLHRDMHFRHQGGVVGHDVHELLARRDDAPRRMHLQADDASRHGRDHFEAALGIPQRAELFAQLEDLAFQLVQLLGGLFDDAYGKALLLQLQAVLLLLGGGDGLPELAVAALMGGKLALQFQDRERSRYFFSMRTRFAPSSSLRVAMMARSALSSSFRPRICCAIWFICESSNSDWLL